MFLNFWTFWFWSESVWAVQNMARHNRPLEVPISSMVLKTDWFLGNGGFIILGSVSITENTQWAKQMCKSNKMKSKCYAWIGIVFALLLVLIVINQKEGIFWRGVHSAIKKSREVQDQCICTFLVTFSIYLGSLSSITLLTLIFSNKTILCSSSQSYLFRMM